jgi:hypothetical protein
LIRLEPPVVPSQEFAMVSVPLLVNVMLAMEMVLMVYAEVPPIAWLLVEKVTVGPVRLKVVPLWLIPFLNSKGELFADENEQPAPTVTSPTKMLEPVLLLSIRVAVPESVRVEPAVKLFTFRFKAPAVRVTAPENVTEFVLVSVRLILLVTVFNVIAEVPAIFCALVVNEIRPVPVKLKVVPLWDIPPLKAKVELLAEEKEQPAPTLTKPTKILAPELLLSMIVLVPD